MAGITNAQIAVEINEAIELNPHLPEIDDPEGTYLKYLNSGKLPDADKLTDYCPICRGRYTKGGTCCS